MRRRRTVKSPPWTTVKRDVYIRRQPLVAGIILISSFSDCFLSIVTINYGSCGRLRDERVSSRFELKGSFSGCFKPISPTMECY
ncbi:hypothetical protein SDJN02_23298, partial [Cucurbita argyrosperma subsp. argyrosperma]